MSGNRLMNRFVLVHGQLFLFLFALLAACGYGTIDWTAYNDCIGSSGGNTTNYSNYSGYTGSTSAALKNYSTGSTTGMPTVTFLIPDTVSIQPVAEFDYGVNPSSGTDAYSVFNGIVDFSGTILQHPSSCGTTCWFVEIKFTNLNPDKKYTFVGSAFRNREYPNQRQTRCTLLGADSYTNNSSAGVDYKVGDVTIFQAANNSNEGYVVRWDNIKPGPDGTFSIYTVSADAGGRLGYPLSGFMLQQIDIGVNTPPVVDAGLDQVITQPRQYLTLTGSVSDDGWGELTGYPISTWSQLSGPATVEFVTDSHQPQVTARFPAVGDYTLQLAAADGFVATADEVKITVKHSVCPVGDVDGDCMVRLSDLSLLSGAWLDDTGLPLLDLNGDTWVNIEELTLLAQSWMEDWTGSLQVTISPIDVRSLGARWRVDGGAWQSSGDIVSLLSEGSHDIDYSVVAGWSAPGTKSVAIARQQTTQASGIYNEAPKAVAISEFMAINSCVPTISAMDIYAYYPWNTAVKAYPDWIELHNTSSDAVNLEGWYLTDDPDNLTKWRFPAGYSLPAGGYFIVFASTKDSGLFPANYPFVDYNGALHTNFDLDANGGYLAVVTPDGMSISHEYTDYPGQYPFTSYGITSDGTAGYMTVPTPGTRVGNKWTGAANTSGLPGKAEDTKFSHNRGFYASPFDVTITCSTAGAEIHYTLDGSEPLAATGGNTLLYTGPIHVAATTCLRAKAFKTGLLPSNTDTQTYLFLEDVVNQVAPTDSRYAAGATAWGGYPSDFEMENNLADRALVAGNAGYTEQQAKDVIKNALTRLPVVSIVSDPNGIFGAGQGIYTHTLNSGDLWERAVSAEYFNGDPNDTFQIDCGMKIQGGASREPAKECKHSFSLRFRGGYGQANLKTDILKSQTDIDTFDSLQFRSTYNNSWRHSDGSQRARAMLIRDQFGRDCMIAMGQESGGAGRFVHLYINGLYWGIYNLHERPEASHYAAYYGGDGDYYDAYNGSTLVDGVSTSWNSLKTLLQTASSSSQSDWEQIQAKLDIDNVIDWTIVECWARNYDLKTGENWKAAGGGVFNAPWKFYLWDTERTVEDGTVGQPLSDVFTAPFFAGYLSNFEEFRIRFADRLYKHFYNQGALTYASAWARYNARATELQDAIIGESARWGDYRRDTRSTSGASLYTKTEWQTALSNIQGYLQAKPANAITYFKGRSPSLYPAIEPPVFTINTVEQSGGTVSVPCAFDMDNTNGVGEIYYTLDGSDPRQYWTGTISPAAVLFDGTPVVMNQSTRVKARVRNGTVWSALHEAAYGDIEVLNSLRITEIMYHSADPNTDFIELRNCGTQPVNLNGVAFTNGINHSFGNITVQPGGFVLLTENLASFNSRYPSVASEVQTFQWAGGSLDNAGEKMTLRDILGRAILSFSYKDSWYPLTDGKGFSLTVMDPAQTDLTLWDRKAGWRTSTAAGGSPGADETGLAPDSILINEILAHSHDKSLDEKAPDWIELYNTTDQPLSLGGWYLSDNAAAPTLYTIAEDVQIPAHGYAVLYEDTSFGSAFALSENGETLYLTSGAGGKMTGYQVSQAFDASLRGISLGRYIKSTGGMDFVAMSEPTPGSANAVPQVGPIVISEIQYNPAAANTGDEYIELRNISSQTVTFQDDVDTEVSQGVYQTETVCWMFTDGIDYTFPMGTQIPAGGVLIVAGNPTAFRAYYGASLPSGTTVLGPFANSTNLSNGGEKVRLCRPGEKLLNTERSWVRVDQVTYDDASPWPTAPDGQGMTLQRINSTQYGNDPANWTAAAPAPGQ